MARTYRGWLQGVDQMNPFKRFTDMELQRLHHAMMEIVYLRELNDPTRMDLLEWARDEMMRRQEEEE